MMSRPDVIATNAFYYYADVETAWTYYRDTLGFETVVDYGFAKIMRIADSSYLTLVRASEGMHTAYEPKTVMLTLITDELSYWREHLVSDDLRLTSRTSDENVNSFVVTDPEGYFLKFVRFNPHPGHDSFVAAFAEATPMATQVSGSRGPLTIRASAFSAYFPDLGLVRSFYENLFDVEPIGQIDGIDTYQLSSSGFLMLVEGSDGFLRPTDQSGMTLSFLTSDIDAWYERAVNAPGFELRTPEVLDEGGLVRVFVGYDPAGTFLEWDTFADVAENAALKKYID